MSDPQTGPNLATSDVRLRSAGPDDASIIRRFILELAEYERLRHEVVVTENDIRETLFGERPAAEVILAFVGDEPAGFALFFHNYSTFLGRRGIYLEDLFVRPTFRGRGIGKRLLREVARLAVERRCGRLEWAVLDWNEPAIAFYRSLGANAMDEWTVFRLTGEALEEVANHEAGADGEPGRSTRR